MPGRNRTQSGFAWFRSRPPAREALALLRLSGGETLKVALAHLLDADLAAAFTLSMARCAMGFRVLGSVLIVPQYGCDQLGGDTYQRVAKAAT